MKGEQQNLRSKTRARIHETPEEAHERREANLRSKARAIIHETPEQTHERRAVDLRNKARASQFKKCDKT